MNEHGKKILVTLTGGGFLWEARALIDSFGPACEMHFVTSDDSFFSVKQNFPPDKLHVISRVTTVGDRSWWKVFRNLVANLHGSFAVIRSVGPIAVICVGTSMAVPLFLAAKLLGKKTVFVESITRVSKPSLTGKILSFLGLCDRFYVQWPEAEKLYRGAIYRGTVL